MPPRSDKPPLHGAHRIINLINIQPWAKILIADRFETPISLKGWRPRRRSTVRAPPWLKCNRKRAVIQVIGGIGNSGNQMITMDIKPQRRADPEELFRKIDVNEDGALNSEEVSSFEMEIRKRINQMLEDKPSPMDFDSDDDVRVSRNEFAAGLHGLRPIGPPPGPPPGGGTGKSQDLKSLIEALSGKSDSNESDSLDTNGDGVVDADEMQAALGNFAKNVMKAYAQTAQSGSQEASRTIRAMSISIVT